MFYVMTIIMLVWILCGGTITLSAIEFMKIKPTCVKIFVAVISGPFSLNRSMWFKELNLISTNLIS